MGISDVRESVDLIIHCHGMTCTDVSDLDSYEFEISITTADFSPVPDVITYSDLNAACCRILMDRDNQSRGDVMMAEIIREKVGENEWALATLANL